MYTGFGLLLGGGSLLLGFTMLYLLLGLVIAQPWVILGPLLVLLWMRWAILWHIKQARTKHARTLYQQASVRDPWPGEDYDADGFPLKSALDD